MSFPLTFWSHNPFYVEMKPISLSRLFILLTKKWVSREWPEFLKILQPVLHFLSTEELENLVSFSGTVLTLFYSDWGGGRVHFISLTPMEGCTTYTYTIVPWAQDWSLNDSPFSKFLASSLSPGLHCSRVCKDAVYK